MYTINDTMFALMLRFVGYNHGVNFCDKKFVKKQLKAIRGHIKKFPQEEQELRAIEWIEEYARQYRQTWEKETVDKEFFNQRCPDCPLSRAGSSKHCQIHDQWLRLLDQYVAGEINSKKYVQNSLKLLAQHKEDLKIKLSALKKD